MMKALRFILVVVWAAPPVSAQLGLERIPRFGVEHPRGVGPVLADVDRDGDLDLFVAPSSTVGNHALWLNDGSGRFIDVTATHLPPLMTRQPSFGPTQAYDYTGDGYVDILINTEVSGFGHGRYYYINDGTGRFIEASTTRIPSHLNEGGAIATLDFDRDGDLDVVLGHNGLFNARQTSLWQNDGTGTFADLGEVLTPVSDPWSLVAADFNGDGWDDIASGHWSGVAVHLNDRNGGFNLHQFEPLNSAGTVWAGDVDGDSDVDIVQDPSTILLNDGFANFVDVGATHHPGALTMFLANFIRLVDLDLDGDVDWVAAGQGNTGANRAILDVLANDGTGRFRRVTRLAPQVVPVGSNGIAVGDLDSDGDFDLVIDDSHAGVRALINTHHQLWAPVPPRVGGTLWLQVASTFARSAYVFASPQRAPAPILVPGFGPFRLDPSMAISSAVIALPGAGDTGVPIAVPDDPALRGFQLFFQAAFLDASFPPRGALSGLWEETIR